MNPDEINERFDIHSEILSFFNRNKDFVRDTENLLEEEDRLFFCNARTDPPRKGSIIGRKLGWKRSKVSRATNRLSDRLGRVSQKYRLEYPIQASLKYLEKQTGLAFHCGHLTIDKVKDNLASISKGMSYYPSDIKSLQRERFHCLRSAKNVLEWEISKKPEWNRPFGPVFCDFKDGRVYRREILDDLKKNVQENPIYLLEGDAATGKSVIIRYMMYEFCKEDEREVYYFDVAQRRDFNEGELVDDIQSVEGIFVIENIHLEPYKIQWIYTRLKDISGLHILFTSRTLKAGLLDVHSRVLTKIRKIFIEPFEEVDKLVDFYCAHRETPKIVSKTRDKIIEVSQKSFWFLAFALRGCGKADGEGEPINWISDQVNEYLNNLEALDERYDTHANLYPNILLALCPLYRNEVLTAECYLVDNLKFNKSALKALAKRGEITRQKDLNGNVYYGLPHSALAEAYWEHGQEYRRNFGEYKDFVQNYAISKTPNSLVATIKMEKHIRTEILKRLVEEDRLQTVIENEYYFAPINLIINYMDINPANLAQKGVLTALARRIDREKNDISSVIDFVMAMLSFDKIDAGRILWRLLDHTALAAKLSSYDDPYFGFFLMRFFLLRLSGIDFDIAREFCKLLDLEKMAKRLNKTQELEPTIAWISIIAFLAEERVMEFWNCLDKMKLRDKVISTTDIDEVRWLVYLVKSANNEIARELCNIPNVRQILEKLDPN